MQEALTRWRVPLVLLVIGVLTHFLWLNKPNQVIFDEVHFGKFITAYCCTKERIFDIHPPHVKLMIAAAGKALGYEGGFAFDHIGEAYGVIPVTGLRTVPALAGVLLPIVLWILARQLGASEGAALLVSVAALFDNALTIQTRVISLDGVLLLATFGSVSAFLATLSYPPGRRQIEFFILAGALAGLAAGAKFTGLVALIILGCLVLWYMIGDKKNYQMWLAHGLLMLVSFSSVYILGWAIHYVTLTQVGSGDAWQIPTGSFINDTIDIHKKMLSANYNLTATHPYSSSWWTWPWMQRPVFYWQGTGYAAIYFLGNPAVWWGGSILFIIACLGAAFTKFGGMKKEKMSKGMALALLGFVIAFLPFVRIPRALFLYHYLTPLLFSLLFGVLWLDKVTVISQRMLKNQPWWFWGIIAVIIVLFFFFSPLTYGFLVSQQWWDALFWLPTWR